MKFLTIFGFLAAFGLMAACSSPEDKVAKEKMKLSEAYQECTQKSKAYKAALAEGTQDRIGESDRMTDEDCETIRKNLEALN